MSAAFARRPLVGWEAAPTYPNIYMLLVGPSGTRKSSALAKAVDLVRTAFPAVGNAPARVHIMADEGSPQGFAGALQRRNYEMTDISDGLIVASELTVLVGKDTYKAALGQWLCSWYDNMAPTWSRALKDETYVLPAPYVCFGGASNMTWLRELPPALLKAGYMPRHLVFSAARKRHDHANPKFSPALRAALIAQLQRVVANIPEEMPLSPGAERLLETWYLSRVSKQEAQESDEHMGLWISRKQSHALKVAVVWQIIDDGSRKALEEEWLSRAIRLVDWMDQGVREVYVALSSTEESEVTDAVLAFIDHAGGRVSLSRITRALRNKYNSRSVQSGVATLLQARIIKQDLTNPTEGMVLAILGDARVDLEPRPR